MFYRQRKDATTNSATTVTVALLPLVAGELVELFAASLKNSSGESVIAQFGILEGSDFFPLSAKVTVANNDSTALIAKLNFYEGQALACQVTGTALAGGVTLWASGLHHSPDPDPPAAAAVFIPAQKLPVPTGY